MAASFSSISFKLNISSSGRFLSTILNTIASSLQITTLSFSLHPTVPEIVFFFFFFALFLYLYVSCLFLSWALCISLGKWFCLPLLYQSLKECVAYTIPVWQTNICAYSLIGRYWDTYITWTLPCNFLSHHINLLT